MGEIDEIIIALKNALERGQGINSAKQSLINAGYSEAAVNSAANTITSGKINPIMQQQAQSTPSVLLSKSNNPQLVKIAPSKPSILVPQMSGQKVDNTIKQLPNYNTSQEQELSPPLPMSEKPANKKVFIILIIIILAIGGYVAYQLSQDPKFFQHLIAKLKK